MNSGPDFGAAVCQYANDTAAVGRRAMSRMESLARMPRANGNARSLVPFEERAPSDEFREIRTRLLALGGGENFVTLVVPVSGGSGGSYVARHLARAFAFDEAKTALLIDCHPRRPIQHEALGVDAAHGGLIDYLEQPTRAVPQIIYATPTPRLRLIPAGKPREWSAEYFSSFRMRALIDTLRARYPDRYILLDGPALRGAPDARILSDLADFVVIVAAYGRDTASVINQAVAGLDAKKIAGVVFNHPR